MKTIHAVAARAMLMLSLVVMIMIAGCGTLDTVDAPRGWDTVDGTVVVASPDGTRLEREDGVLRLSVRDTWGVSAKVVPVRGGRWAIAIPPDALLEIRSAVLGDRWAYDAERPAGVSPMSRGRRPNGGRFAVVMRRPPPLRLEVVSRASGQTLDGVVLGLASVGSPHDGVFERLPAETESPVLVPDAHLELETRLEYWVGATGHDWRKVTLDHARGGLARVELDAR